jgi:hypothetical protein
VLRGQIVRFVQSERRIQCVEGVDERKIAAEVGVGDGEVLQARELRKPP